MTDGFYCAGCGRDIAATDRVWHAVMVSLVPSLREQHSSALTPPRTFHLACLPVRDPNWRVLPD